ncbi:peptidase [Alteromonas aestuariivivens]|uniref:Peptidase n=2 Tax=Alteromonas aestuariivivens TaxID=1938339 RepID=A0A3D8M3L7_9ALTE|nr:peptidase [Alteromonas aestuariivivens]
MLWLVCISVLAAPDAHAQQQNGNDNKTIDKAQAAKRAAQKVDGRVLRVDQSANKYRVKVLKKNGRVVSVDVDRRSGQVKPVQEQ